MNVKNMSVPGAAAADLGLGDILQNQTEAEIVERRKKMLAVEQQKPADFGALGMGSAMSLGLGA